MQEWEWELSKHFNYIFYLLVSSSNRVLYKIISLCRIAIFNVRLDTNLKTMRCWIETTTPLIYCLIVKYYLSIFYGQSTYRLRNFNCGISESWLKSETCHWPYLAAVCFMKKHLNAISPTGKWRCTRIRNTEHAYLETCLLNLKKAHVIFVC